MGWSAVAPIILIIINASWIHVSTTAVHASHARSLKALELTISKESWVGEISEKAGQLYGRCSLQSDESPDKGTDKETQCNDSLSCVPVLTVPVEASARNIFERTGMCVEFPSGKANNGVKNLPSAYLFDSLNEKPLPIGYFPFTFKDAASWPFPSFEGSLNGAEFVDDDVFGSALHCKQSVVELPTIPYTGNGDFTVNLWVKSDGQGQDAGIGYIFSHKKLGLEEGSQSNPQIQVFVPRKFLSAHGIVRAVVKDNNDIDEGPTINSFVDSDGEVGNDLDRDASRDLVNVSDGKWHMITVTSQGAGEKGFRLYIDGEVVGELSSSSGQDEDVSSDIQVTGGDSLDLDGPISLCGVSDSEDEHFKGYIAHIALFDQTLSAASVRDLYETLIVTQIQVDQVHKSPSVGEGRSGKTCLFPAIYRGEVVHNCVPREATKECPTSAGVWEECSFFSSEAVDFFQTLDVYEAPDGDSRFAVELPMYYAGVYHNECIDLHGTPSCFTSGGIWKECAEPEAKKDPAAVDLSKVSRKTIYGQDCMFPFEYRGEVFEDCADILGDWSCGIETGEYFPCSVEQNPATLYRENSTAPVISRVTMGGESCFFPLWYGEESIADCFPEAGGVLSCPTTPGEIEPCAPLRLTINGNPCAMPFFFGGEEHFDCAEYAGQTICMTADGSIDQCAPYSALPQPYKSTEGLHAVTARGTVTDENCAFPYWYGGKLISDCVTEDGVEYCQTGDGAWRECLPLVFTEDGRKCSIPFHHEEDFHFDCVVVDGSYKCPTALDEPWGDCKGYYYAPVPEPSSEFDELEEDESSLLMDELNEGESLEVPRVGSTEDHFVGPNQVDSLTQSWIGELTGSPGKELGECRLPMNYDQTLNEKKMPKCSSDKLSCIPIRSSSELNLIGEERKGACFGFPGGSEESPAYIFDADNEMPVPQAYFPLAHNSTDSWPFDHLKGEVGDQIFVDDDVFGSVLQCNKGTVRLPNIQYASSGRFAINLWVKTETPAPGIGFEYIFSHMKEDAIAGLRGLSQIQLYLPRQIIPSHGVLRAVVKDNNDEDEGRASDSFVDSDGMIGNNLARDFGSDHPDFYDGLWHMVTISSEEDEGKGFKLFVDGVLAGEMGAEKVAVIDGEKTVELQVTGGDPIDLSGKIHLCGRAVNPEARYFNGQIAHLAVFTSPLSTKHVQDLFETYMATKAQSEGRPLVSTELTAINEDPCLFPALYKGKWVDTCVRIDNVEKCPTAPGKWVECSSASMGSVAKFVTIDDEPCELPIFYEGSLHKECVQIEGIPMCHARQGPWKECRSSMQSPVERWDPPSWEEHYGTSALDVAALGESIVNTRSTSDEPDTQNVLSEDILNHDGLFETVDGEECEFPIFYVGELHYRCIPIDGVPKCHAPGGAWKECRVRAEEIEVEDMEEKESGKKQPPSKGTSELATQVTRDTTAYFAMNLEAPAITRVTVDGDQCFFPFWYGEESISGCFAIDGRQNCPTKTGAIKECASLRLTVDGLPCAMPFSHEGKDHSDCLEIDGDEHCRTADGDLKRCAPAANQQVQTDEYKIVTSRATVNGANCALPFWYKGKLVSDCIQKGTDEYCRTMFGGWEKCAPQKFTVDGKKCSIPFHHEGKNYFDCINLGGVRKCPTAALEPWGECESESAGVNRSSTG